MRLTTNDIGKLVRPRVLTHVYLWTAPANTHAGVDSWWKTIKDQYQYLSSHQAYQLTKTYNKPLQEIFEGLSLGDTSVDLSKCYVAQVSSFIVMFKGTYYIVDSVKRGKQFEDMAKKAYGPNAKVSIFAVGLKFFEGMTRQSNGTLKPINPSALTTIPDKTWFYLPKHIVPVENIIRFEAVVLGDLVMFKESGGMVVSVNILNKARFFKTNSWSNRSVKLFSSFHLGYIRFLPNKNFSIKSKGKQETW